MEACGVTAGWGENIAYGYATADAVMQGWLNSPGHRANIERSTYRAIGVGAATGSNSRIYWAQVFSTSTSGGSTPPPPPACSNGKDDDGDGKIDYPADPGCTSQTDSDEFNAAPPPPPPPPPPPSGGVTAFPSALTVNAGTPLAGGPSSLAADDGRTLGTTETETVATVTGALASYVSGSTGNGDVAVRVACAGSYFTSFTTSSELLKITYS